MTIDQKIVAFEYAVIGFFVGVFLMLEIARRMGKL